MSGRPSAIREVTDRTQALMDGLLVEEQRAAREIEDALRGFCVTLRDRVVGVGGSRRALRSAVPRLLPTTDQILVWAGPVVAQLLAVSRERTLPVVHRQLEACRRVVGVAAVGAAARGVAAATDTATELEAHYYAAATAAIGASVAVVTGSMVRQADVWAARPAETPEDLARRWCSEDLVRLAGAPGRGVVWRLRSVVSEQARAGSVAVVNGLLLAGYAGWNSSPDTE